MSTVIWLLTSPRIPAGLLTIEAWDALHDADAVAGFGDSPTVQAVRDAGIDVELVDDAAAFLEEGGVWIVGDDGDEELRESLAEYVAGGEIELEVVYGSWDPPGARLLDLVAAVDQLHADEGGCPWHREQSHESLAPFLLEEAYEVLDAIAAGETRELEEELGDLLFQPVLHARLAAGREEFDIDDVAGALVDKIIRRHPHVWGDADPDDLYEHWHSAKAAEKPDRDHPADGLSRQLPSMAFAAKVIDRFADAGKPLDLPALPESVKVEADDAGEFLLAAVAAARAAGVDPELALRRAIVEKAGLDQAE
ncbi:nucleoside triphosphate pyrophosphohydrolase [Glycomyces sp. L485]|uniref:MazG nucleotide pyrophosphohydrolase domain-containing protein n=1 Tax=Glycomyces sp. L485 TaxID=2909235 RepID=UPI001F4B36C3|nr:MazG nucleotide pyrophosphohydrolase domain-containing protein [Glycomyces sp. L485]MCH7231668.1 nucleoside triphosphate pyrophosphohydrolase [Glycomyces sp. L485]